MEKNPNKVTKHSVSVAINFVVSDEDIDAASPIGAARPKSWASISVNMPANRFRMAGC
jgi:hypothetical protein